ncbi:MAG: hypothetical protein LBI73_14830 [Myroides sp.]|jgi:hypothetical protein|nr:hypothetical protein [Myroides sp.]
MKKSALILFSLILSFFTPSCSKDDSNSDISTYNLKVTTNPTDAMITIGYQENGEFIQITNKGAFEKTIKRTARDPKRVLVTYSNSKKDNKNTYIKIELYKRKKLVKSIDGNYIVQLDY